MSEKRWDYRVVGLSLLDAEELLTEYGKGGWELVSVMSESKTYVRVFLKKEVG